MENLTQTVSTAWLPALVGIYLLRNSGPHPSHKLSSHIMCEVFRRWPVATCLRLRERPGGSCQSLISEGLQVPPLLRRTGSTLATSLEGPLLMPQRVSYVFSPGLRAPGPSSWCIACHSRVSDLCEACSHPSEPSVLSGVVFTLQGDYVHRDRPTEVNEPEQREAIVMSMDFEVRDDSQPEKWTGPKSAKLNTSRVWAKNLKPLNDNVKNKYIYWLDQLHRAWDFF